MMNINTKNVNNLISYLKDTKLSDTSKIGKREHKKIQQIILELNTREEKIVTEKRLLYNSMFCICPNCNTSIEREYQSYCDRCGQKLKWGSLKKISIKIHISK